MRKEVKKNNLAWIVMLVFFFGIAFSTCFVNSSFAATWTQPPRWGNVLSSADYNSWAADDFRFMGETVAISTVDWWSERSIDDPSPQGFYIRFYDDYYDFDLGLHYADTIRYETYIEGFSQVREDNLIHYSADLTTPFVASANTRYWISVQAYFGDWTWWGWVKSSTDNLSSAEYNSSSKSHEPLNSDLAFEIQGSPVPIPGAVWLLGSGLFGLVVARRKKRSV